MDKRITNWCFEGTRPSIVSAAVLKWTGITPAHRPRVTDPMKVYRPSGRIDSKMPEWQKDGNTYLKGNSRLHKIFLKAHNHLDLSVQENKFKPRTCFY